MGQSPLSLSSFFENLVVLVQTPEDELHYFFNFYFCNVSTIGLGGSLFPAERGFVEGSIVSIIVTVLKKRKQKKNVTLNINTKALSVTVYLRKVL